MMVADADATITVYQRGGDANKPAAMIIHPPGGCILRGDFAYPRHQSRGQPRDSGATYRPLARRPPAGEVWAGPAVPMQKAAPRQARICGRQWPQPDYQKSCGG